MAAALDVLRYVLALTLFGLFMLGPILVMNCLFDKAETAIRKALKKERH